jgi:hypothetical protein
MAFPDEILAGPVGVWVAPTGTVFPLVNVAPAASWVVLGSQEALHTDEDGVTIESSVETEDFVPLGSIDAVKSWITGQDLRVRFNLADLRLETLSHAFGGPPTAAGNVIDVPAASGAAGYRHLSLTRTGIPTQVAMLVRALQSPYDDDPTWAMQWELNRVAQIAAVPLQWVKGVPVKAAFEYRVYRDAAGVGRIVAQDAAPLP